MAAATFIPGNCWGSCWVLTKRNPLFPFPTNNYPNNYPVQMWQGLNENRNMRKSDGSCCSFATPAPQKCSGRRARVARGQNCWMLPGWLPKGALNLLRAATSQSASAALPSSSTAQQRPSRVDAALWARQPLPLVAFCMAATRQCIATGLEKQTACSCETLTNEIEMIGGASKTSQ